MSTIKPVSLLIITALAISLGACSQYRNYPMGNSVASIEAKQTAYPGGHTGPKEGLDAYKAESAIRVYRSDVSNPTKVEAAADARKID